MPVRKQLFFLKKADLPQNFVENWRKIDNFYSCCLYNSQQDFHLMFCLVEKYFDYFRGGEAVTLIEMRDYN